tara:strand:+ start:87 stop:329 length:243 start_codon:yes stop_codon:yes gene_type:complete
MFNNTVLNSIIEAETTGTDFRADLEIELDVIERTIKSLQAMKQARREIAVEEGFAQFNQVTIKEHIRKEHIQNRFAWIKD